jgi:hypothetical protein
LKNNYCLFIHYFKYFFCTSFILLHTWNFWFIPYIFSYTF